jgi:hypothetical protein
MSHSSINAKVRVWAERHCLGINYGWAGRELWGTYLSSAAGECFQIWIEPTTNGTIGVHANYVDGPKERLPDPEQAWTVEESELEDALDHAYKQVINWMAPSTRHFPSQ